MSTILFIFLFALLSQNSVRLPDTKINVFGIYKTYHKNRLIKAMVIAESGGRWDAYNAKENAVGVMQLRPVMVKHINKISDSNYTLDDRLDSLKSVEMFNKLMALRNPSYNFDIACELWNSGMINPQRDNIKIKVNDYKKKVLSYY